MVGFSNSAVITVGSMFLISRGLIRNGAVGFVTELVLGLSKGKKPNFYPDLAILNSYHFNDIAFSGQIS